MANRLPLSGAQWWDATNRQAYSGAKMYTYADQSRTTDKETFDAADEGSSLTNPIIADSNGIFPEIYGNGAYFIDVYSSDDSVLIYQEDSLFPTQPVSSDGSSSITVDTIADLQDVSTTQFKYAFVLGTSAIDDGGQASYYFDAASTATPDGTTIVQPNTGSGRWLILNVETLSLGDQSVTQPKLAWYPLEVIEGLEVTNNTTDADHDIDIAIGSIADSTQTRILNLESAMTKRLDATFAVGTGLGGMCDQDDSGTLVADSTYHVYIIGKADGTTDIIGAKRGTDPLTDTVAAAAGFIYKRRIFTVMTRSDANILAYHLNTLGYVNWSIPYSVTTTVSGAGALSISQSPPLQMARLTYELSAQTSTSTDSLARGYISEESQTNVAPTTLFAQVTAQISAQGLGNFTTLTIVTRTTVDVICNGSQEFRHREAGNAQGIHINTMGWFNDLTVETGA